MHPGCDLRGDRQRHPGLDQLGAGLVAGAFLARSVALNLRKVDFKLYVAVAYTGAIITGLFGISGSEFLLVNTPGYFMEDMLGLIPLSQTVFEPSLLIAQALGLIIVVPLLAALIHTDPKDTPEMDPAILDRFLEQEEAARALKVNRKKKSEMTVAERIDNSFTAGETISNIIQPFWAIPLLGIAGLKMKDIMGYCIIFFVVLTAIFFGVWAVMW